MYCKFCGSPIKEDAIYCAYCGEKQTRGAPTGPEAQAASDAASGERPDRTRTVYDPTIDGYRVVPDAESPPRTAAPRAAQPKSRADGYNISLVFGILSIVFSTVLGAPTGFVLGALVGLAFGILGIVFGIRSGNRAGKICGIVGTALAAVVLLAFLLLVVGVVGGILAGA